MIVFAPHRQLLASAEPDLSAAVTLLRPIRGDHRVSSLWRQLTCEHAAAFDEEDLTLVVHRLRHPNPRFSLSSLQVSAEMCEAPALLSALAVTTNLGFLFWGAKLESDVGTRLAVQLRAVPSLHSVDLNGLPAGEGLKLLQSRTNWRMIEQLCDAKDIAQINTFAALNRSDFRLRVPALHKAEELNPWLLNPHLTSLHVCIDDETGAVAGCFDGLRHCKNLTELVRHCSVCRGVLALIRVVRLCAFRADFDCG
jgi:hypothetical protein